MRKITVSEMKAYRRCPRLHDIRYRQGYRTTGESGPLFLGKMVHAAIKSWMPGRDLALAHHELDSQSEGPPPDTIALATARAMMTGYHHRWAGDGLEVCAAEVEFAAPLVNPATGAASKTFELAGKIDAIVRDSRGDTWIVEHKTSSADISSGSTYWQQLRLDSQISTYMVGARSLGYRPVGVIYDVLRKPGLRPKMATPAESRKYTKDGVLYATQRDTDESPAEFEQRILLDIAEKPESYFVRGEVMRLESDEQEAAADCWQIARMIREAEVMARAPRNADACMAYSRACDYFAVCTHADSLDNADKFRRAEMHEELGDAK